MEESESHHPPQFSLKRLFAITAKIAAALGAFHWIGSSPVFLLVLMMAAAKIGYCIPRRRSDKWACSVAACLLSPVLAAVILPVFRPPGCGSLCTRQSACMNNLKQIGLGLQTYVDIHGCLPPAYIADDSGRPVHSWRVLLLPYIEQTALYEKYDFNEPWDGPHNRLLARQMPAVYRCPADATPGAISTSYVAIKGPQTALRETDSTGRRKLTDRALNTIAVVEIAGSDINWLEPRDLPFRALKNGVNPKNGLGMSSRHGGGAWCVFCDGHTLWLSDAMPAEMLEALATMDGGEVETDDY